MTDLDINKINYEIMKGIDSVLKKHNIDDINLDKNVKEINISIAYNQIPTINITYQCIPDN